MIGRPVIPARLCAIWPGHGAATATTRIDGREVPACAACADCDEGRERTMRGFSRDAVVAAVAVSPGVRSDELARQFVTEANDEDERIRSRSAFSVFIGRMIAEGRLRCERVGSSRQRSGRKLWVAA